MTASFEITRRDGTVHEVLVDDNDLDRVLAVGRWSIDGGGYVTYGRTIDGQRVDMKLHRFIVGAKPGDPDVDHIDGNPLNCQRGNLRICPHATNLANQAVENGRGASRYRGVYRRPNGRFYAQQVVLGDAHCLGTYDTEAEAAAVLAAFRAERNLGGYPTTVTP